MDKTPRSKRHPDAIMADFQTAIYGLADTDPYEILWEIIDDVCDSYRLAMSNHLNDSAITEIEGTVNTYVLNHYGDN